MSTTKKWLLQIAVATTIAIFGCSAHAQITPISPELKSFLTRPDEQRAYNSMMGEQWRLVVENCPSPRMTGQNVLVLVSPKFDAGGTPLSGSWKVVGQLDGCGATRRMNILYIVGSDGRLAKGAILPGSTVTSVRLQHDAFAYASVGMSALMPKDCKDVRVVDTKFVGFDGVAQPTMTDMGNHSWTEEWTARACGTVGIVIMHFAPNPPGTQINVNLKETRKVNP